MNYFKQSPINIEPTATHLTTDELNFNYNCNTFTVDDSGQNIRLLPTAMPSTVTYNGLVFPLSEIHFHKPSEHTISGSYFDMEVHFVHNRLEQTLVYSIILNLTDDGYDFGRPFDNINNNIKIDLQRFKTQEYYKYFGSFTTVPFSENVIWIINKQHHNVSMHYLAKLDSFYPCNNRCLQPLNMRDVYSVCNSNK